MANRFKQNDQFFIETKMGILTRAGDWFHTTGEQIERFAPGLLTKVSLAELIKTAQAWVKSADSVSLIVLYGLLFWINPWIAAAIVLLFHWVWYHQKSAFVVRGAGILLRIINSDIFLFLIAFISLTLLGYRGDYAAVGVGIGYFFVMKPGLLKKGWDRLDRTRKDELTLNDRILKMVIVKQALYENVTITSVENMEDTLRTLAFNRKKGK